MRRALTAHGRHLLAVIVLALVGLAAAFAVLVQQRLPMPLSDDYEVRVVLPAADGVAPGLGQPVNVSGVRVGAIAKARIVNRSAELTLRIERGQLPRLHRDARAFLRPITPVKDMELDLDPGDPGSPALPEGGRIPVERNASPVPLSDLLSRLDGDTRGFLATLLHGLGHGTAGRAPDLRRLLVAMGPTAGQVRRISVAIDRRRTALARLVRNTAAVTEAAASDGRLATVVDAGSRTLRAISRSDAQLREGLGRLPAALSTFDRALASAGELGDELGPAARELRPPVRRLPALFDDLRDFTDPLTPMLRTDLRPLVRQAQPLVRQLDPALTHLGSLMPDLTRVTQTLNILFNELGYNPPGKEEGLLYWISWFFHNYSSAAGGGDANGATLRAAVNVNCDQIDNTLDLAPLFRVLLGASTICPAD